MRYEENTIPPESSPIIGADSLTGYVIYGLVLGIGMLIAGWRGKQMWFSFWGGILALGSAGYLSAYALGLAS